MGISLGIMFGLISMLGYGLASAISKVPVQKIGGRKTIFFGNILVSLILLAVLLFFLPEINLSINHILIALGIGIIGYVPIASFYEAIKLGKVSVVAPISKSSVIFTVLLSFIFFKENLRSMQIISIFFIIIGIFLISVNFKDLKNSHLFKISSGILFALIASILWGLVFFLLKFPVSVLGPILTAFLIEIGVMVSSLAHLKFTKVNINLPDRKTMIYIFFLGVFVATGMLFYNLGISKADVSIVAALTFSSPLVAVIYGKFAYNEKFSLLQYIAILSMLSGIVMVSYF
jgi:drug/metabolite transporter (DMT)-like permease